MRLLPIVFSVLTASGAALADQVTVTGGTVYVTKSDCAQLVAHHPAPGVAYQPGVDVHGKYVAPADLPGTDATGLVPGGIHFDITVNPMAYAGRSGSSTTTGQAGKYPNTAAPVAHVDVDLASGEARLNGQPLTPAQDKALFEACHKAGLR